MLYPGRRRSSSMASTHVSSSSSNSSVSSWSSVGLEDLTVVRRLGSGDIGNVYLCQLPRQTQSDDDDDECVLLAMKVVDMEAVALKNKLERAEMEKKILCMIDHPFLPTLYSHFQASHFSCFLIDFCPRGDLFASRLRQPSSRFSISAAKFYAAETLVALEYLHMMGIVYRDLKPENVLIREDGHIMLSDFDLCLKSDVVPKLLPSTLSSSSSSSCRRILGNHPLLSCFFSSKKQGRRQKEEVVVIAEPVKVRSKSMVGTHEYLAPEVISGEGHGAAVDWWTLGVFLYELLYGITPFKGRTNHDTLRNILKQHLRFPKTTVIECGKDLEDKVKAHDLIAKLLVKNPKKRMGSRIGAAEIKRHPFFQDINWALIRSIPPPHTPTNSNRVFAPKLVCKKHRDNVLPYNNITTTTNSTTTTQQHTHHFDYF